MRILVRLPNWLGDMVMSVGFIRQLHDAFPDARISVIAKQGLDPLLSYFPFVESAYPFNKAEFRGSSGAWRFGRRLKAEARWDIHYCLPNSLSSAVMAYASGAQQRVGFRKEMRQVLFTSSYPIPSGLHRAEEYVRLLEQHTGRPSVTPDVRLEHSFVKQDYLVVNINSEASSRRLTSHKAVELIARTRSEWRGPIVLIGAPKEQAFVTDVFDRLPDKSAIDNMSGATNLEGLAKVLASARAVLSTDSGPAHLANALRTPTLVLFGAGNEFHTAPYNKAFGAVIRLGKLSCEPCQKNVCVRYAVPQCLEQLPDDEIIRKLDEIADYG